MSLPDIDIDFCERRRGEVIEYVTRKYGRENVAQIITFGTMKAKAVVRDVGARARHAVRRRRQGRQADSAGARHDARQGARGEPGAQGACEQNDPKVKELLDVARRLEGMTRHASVHAAGVVIAPGPITDYAPLYKGSARRNRHPVGDEGGRARRPPEDGLPRAEHADADPRRARGDQADRPAIELDIDDVPLDDAKTYQLFAGRPDLRHLPVRELAACATSCARPSRSGSTT